MLSAFLILLPFVVVVAVIGIAILYFTQRDKKGFSFNTVFLSYFYTVAIISLMAIVVGTTTIGSALLSDAFGRDFTYESYTEYYDTEPAISDDGTVDESTKAADLKAESVRQSQQQERDRIEAKYQDDIFAGVSALIVGILFFMVHFIGWKTLEKKGDHPDVLFKAYIFAQLAIFSIATLISLPLAISQLLRFLIQPVGQATQSVAAPGLAVTFVLSVLPLWLFFAYRTIKLARQG